MNKISRFQRVMLALLLLNFGMTFSVAAQNNTPVNQDTTVYKYEKAIPGPMGQAGAQGMSGIGTIGPAGATTYIPYNVEIKGQPAPACSVTQAQDLSAIITCPDGSSVVIPKPSDGVDATSRNIEIRKNPDTGNIEKKYDDDLNWVTIISKCDYDPTAPECSNGD